MKKIGLFLIASLIMTMVLTGCADADESIAADAVSIYEAYGDAVVITERFFVNQIMEVFMNHEIYLGRLIQYEGMFYDLGQGSDDFFAVIRYTFGCCGVDGRIGFQVVLDDFQPLPDDTWVEVSGILEMNDGFLMLRVVALSEKDERGSEVVT